MPQKPEIKACLFDMDGLLIDTEDMYTIATNEVLARYNKGPLPWSVKVNLQGRPGPAAAKLLLEWAQIPLTLDELITATNEVQSKLWPRCQFLPGAAELIKYLHSRNIPIALATSSTQEKYLIKTAHLRPVFDLFGKHVVTGDDPRIPPGKGKPAPDIWLVALDSLNTDSSTPIAHEECLIFEDGIPGVEGGQAAGCTVIWVPHPEAANLFGKPKMKGIIESGKGEILTSLKEFDVSKYGL